MTHRRIEDYALVGDCKTAALISRDGSIDWLCWPRFDSGACFAALLGEPEHGRWLIAPKEPRASVSRRYLDGSLILVTTFETATGAVELVDFMPAYGGSDNLVRMVRGLRGHVDLYIEFVLRFDYGSIVPWVEGFDGGLRAVAGPEMAVLRTAVPLCGRDFTTVGDFTVGPGDVVPFVLSYGPSQLPPPQGIDPESALRQTEEFWRTWSDRCAPAGRWTGAVKCSLTALKGLTYAPTGGIVAARRPRCPNKPGRAQLGLSLLLAAGCNVHAAHAWNAGYYEEARDWRDWLLRAVAGRPDQRKSCTALAANAVCPNGRCRGCRASKARVRSASATPPRRSFNSMSTARLPTRCSRPACTACLALNAGQRSGALSSNTLKSFGVSLTRASGKCAVLDSISRTQR